MNKKNKGSALTMVLVLLIFASYISLMVLNMSYTNMKISRSYIGDRRMYRGTDYVVNLISLRLQNDIKEMQNQAKQETEDYFNNPNNQKAIHDLSGQSYLTKTGAMSEEDYSYEFNKKYREVYKSKFTDSRYNKDEATGFSQDTLDRLITNGQAKVEDYGEEYFKTKLVQGESIYYKLKKGWYNETENLITFVIETKFEYTNEITGDNNGKTNLQNKNTATVVFKISDNNQDFNLQNYKVVNTKNDELPIFSSQIALLSEKNIMFKEANGTTITGDAIAFGYSPTNEDAQWNDYGGIFFGSSTKIGRTYSRSNAEANTYRKNIFGNSWITNMGSIFNSNKEAGNITINGNVATMGYVNVANNRGKKIYIKGDTFARQFIMSEDSHGSEVYLGEEIQDVVSNKYKFYDKDGNMTISKDKNEILGKGILCVTDDLQVDSSYSKLEVRGNFYGLSDSYNLVGGGSGSDLTNEKRISTLNINGNSIVELRSKVYIGGTSVLTEIKSNDNNKYSYTTGISGAKTSQISAEAYIKNDNNQYVYTNTGSASTDIVTASYIYQGDVIDMINGYGSISGSSWLLPYRAIHFKKYFDQNVLGNFGLMGTMNFGNLRVKTDSNGNIDGWAQGVIIAAGIKDFSNILGTEKVNAYYDIGDNDGSRFTEGSNDVFKAANPYSQYSMIQKYQTYMSTFLDSSNFGTLGRNIVQRSVDKSVDDYLSDSKSVMNLIKNEADNSSQKVCLYNNSDLGAILYYSKNDKTVLSKNGSSLNITSGGITKIAANKKGIIFVEGDIYIEDGVEFCGTIVAKGNITISGQVNITRYRDYYDGSNKADIVSELKEKDCYVKTFFGLNDYELDSNDNLNIQRINQDYAKIVKWTLE